MVKKIVVLDILNRKPLPLAELDEKYRAELKEWMEEWFPDESEAPLEPSPSMLQTSNKKNKLPCKRSIQLS